MRVIFILFAFSISSLSAAAYCVKRDAVIVEVDYWGVWRKDLKKLSMVTPNQGKFARIHMGYQDGLRGRLEIMPAWWGSVEFRFEGLLQWKRREEITNGSGMAVFTDPYTTTDWPSITELEYRFRSRFDSYEFSYLQYLTPARVDYFSFAVVAGIRAIDFRDRIILTNNFTDDFTVNCKNWPIGAEAGGILDCNPEPYINWRVDARVGIYDNIIKKSFFLTDDSNSVLVANKSHKKNQLAFTTEILASFTWRPSSIFFIFGGDYFVLYNVAFAPSQIKFNRSLNEIYSRKNLTLQSLFVGGGFAF